MFNSSGPHFCPNCPPEHIGRADRQRRVGPRLECVVHNYSGTGVDIAECPKCQKRFEVSYKVDKITQIGF